MVFWLGLNALLQVEEGIYNHLDDDLKVKNELMGYFNAFSVIRPNHLSELPTVPSGTDKWGFTVHAYTFDNTSPSAIIV